VSRPPAAPGGGSGLGPARPATPGPPNDCPTAATPGDAPASGSPGGAPGEPG
jgi:hypothetical protein